MTSAGIDYGLGRIGARKMTTRKLVKTAAEQLGYKLGETYLDHYWHEVHTIVASDERSVASYWHTQRRVTVHFTRRDKRDRVIPFVGPLPRAAHVTLNPEN